MIKRTAILFSIWVLGFACRKPFQPDVIQVDYHYLVVDGVINANPNGITTITLSRTKNLSDSLPPDPEPGATVSIESENGSTFSLLSQGQGKYATGNLTLQPGTNYRLKINTTDGAIYQSEYVSIKQTPPIDSVSWKQNLDSPNKSVTIFAHTHDPQNKTHFYRWDYVETWEYTSPLQGFVSLDAQNLIFYTDSTTQTNTCWGTTVSPNISTASSETLGQDLISYQPIEEVPQNDERMGIKYSINVKQYALTKEAYSYWTIVNKSSQQTGSIFDPQPAQLKGNLHCLNHPELPVIGFVSASYITEKRIFIKNQDLVDWHYSNNPGSVCKIFFWPTNPVDFRIFSFPDTSYQPYYFSGTNTLVAKKECLDCRRRGGTNQKPSFWQ